MCKILFNQSINRSIDQSISLLRIKRPGFRLLLQNV